MQATSPIGLFDSGIGGLTVLRALRQVLPAEKFIYLGDTARTPYGSKSRETVIRYSRECADFLAERGVKLIVVACNTASAAALSELEQGCACPVVGTIKPIVNETLLDRPRRVLVLGTDATVRSGAYERSILASAPATEVVSRACPLFVPLVEEGIWDGPIVDQVIDLYLSEYRAMNFDAVILGCTHYPLIAQALQRYFGSGVKVIESAMAVATEVKNVLGTNTGRAGGVSEFFLTDQTARFRTLAKALLGCEVDPVIVELKDLKGKI